MWNKIKENGIVLAVIVLSVAAVILFQLFGVKSYSRYSTDSLHYEQGKVVEVSSENLEYDEELGLYLGNLKGGNYRRRAKGRNHRSFQLSY